MAARKKTKTAAKPRTTKAQREEAAAGHRQLLAVLMFAAGIFFIALTSVEGENFWQSLHFFLFGVFGWCAYLIGPAFIYIAVMATLERPYFSAAGKVWQVLGLVVLVCAATQIFADGMPAGGFPDQIKALYEAGKELQGGGVLACIVGIPLTSFLGETGAKITVAILIFVMLMVLTGTTLIDLYRKPAKAGKKIQEVYTEQVELRRQQQAERQAQIDIPLDNQEPMPEHPVQSPNMPVQSVPLQADPVQRAKEKLLGAQTGAGGGRFDVKPVPGTQGAAGAPAYRSPIDIPLDEIPPAPAPDLTADDADEGYYPQTQEQQPEQPQQAAQSAQPEKERPEPVKQAEPAAEKPEEASPGADGKTPEELEELIKRAAQQETVQKGTENPNQTTDGHFKVSMMDDLTTDAYQYPPITLLKEVKQPDTGDITDELKQNADLLVDTLNSFGVQTRVIDISRGPAVTRYELQPSAGVKISKITNLADDIALNLAAAGVRIEAPIPNKAAVGIEVPNKNVGTVSIREIIDSNEFVSAKSKLSVALGRDITGNTVIADLAKMPHLLIAGATGSGKSVCINSMIVSLLYKASPEEVRLLMVDPKVVELGVYNGIPHLLVPVVTDPRKAAGALNWAVSEMLGRYKLFADNGVRDLRGFNELAQKKEELSPMPQIVIVIDELSDLMMAAPSEVEDAICRLAQMARAAGMHLVIATQRPSVDVITGIIKANIPSRIAFAVSSHVDSRTILDSSGAEKLLGRGDMLFYPVGAPKPQRIQGCFVSDREVEQVVAFVKDGENAEYDEQILEEIEKQAAADKTKKGAGDDSGGGFDDDDEMLPAAIECVVEMGQASTSLLQRRLKLGYARAARIVDQMEQKGIVGPFEGSKPRAVLISKQQWIEMKLREDT